MANRCAQYRMWKQSLYKWDAYIANRHRENKQIDSWSQRIVQNVIGTSLVFNSGGLFFRDFMPDVVVMEFESCPGLDLPHIKFLSHGATFYREFDNIIMNNPISLKYNHSILDFLTRPGLSRAGPKPCILDWLRNGAKIWLSTSDWHIYFDRLKYSVHDMVADQIRELARAGIRCDYLEIGPVHEDIENGNIKMVLTIDDVENVLQYTY